MKGRSRLWLAVSQSISMSNSKLKQYIPNCTCQPLPPLINACRMLTGKKFVLELIESGEWNNRRMKSEKANNRAAQLLQATARGKSIHEKKMKFSWVTIVSSASQASRAVSLMSTWWKIESIASSLSFLFCFSLFSVAHTKQQQAGRLDEIRSHLHARAHSLSSRLLSSEA